MNMENSSMEAMLKFVEKEIDGIRFKADVLQEYVYRQPQLLGGEHGTDTVRTDTSFIAHPEPHTELIGESCSPGCDVCGQ